VFIHGLFNDAVSSSDYIASNDGMNMNELERIWKDTVVVLYTVLFAYSYWGKPRKTSNRSPGWDVNPDFQYKKQECYSLGGDIRSSDIDCVVRFITSDSG
jgi:hypothetical protein